MFHDQTFLSPVGKLNFTLTDITTAQLVYSCYCLCEEDLTKAKEVKAIANRFTQDQNGSFV